MSLFTELKRRNVFRVAAAYIVVAWLLTEILATLMPMFGVPDWVGKAVVIVVAVTFIPVLIFAWAFEMTPEGIKREKDVVRDSSITSHTGKKLDYVTIVAVVVGVGFLGWSKSGTEIPEPAIEITETSGAPSVAVLPFVNMSGNAENEYFSDGLTDTLLHMLAQIPDIKVAARTSSFAFKGQEQDIRKIALALGVAHVLEGSVQRSGDKIRVTAQLIRADDGFHVWSSNYDRTLNDIFAIQDEIATDVGKSLTASLLGEDAVQIDSIGTENVIAYDLYLQALDYLSGGSYGSLTKSEDLLKEALLLDAGFHDARRMLAIIYIQQQSTGMREQSEAFGIARALLEQVLLDKPDDVSAQASITVLDAYIDESAGAYMAISDALPRLEVLVSLAPNDVNIRTLYARMLNETGQVDEALSQIEKALIIDPVNPQLHYQVGNSQVRLQNWDAARAALERSLQLNPDQPNAHGRLADIAYETGDGVGAVNSVLNAMKLDPRDQELPSSNGSYLYHLGMFEEADEFRDRAALIAPNSPSARLVELEGATARGDREESDRLARSMIIDDIDERHGSYFEAVYIVLQNGIAREDAAEALEFMASHRPGFNDPTSSLLSFKVRYAQIAAFAAWDAAYGRQKASEMASDYWRIYIESGNLAADNPEIYMEVLALSGEVDAAVDLALAEVVSRPISTMIWNREVFDSSHMAEVVADPRIQARFRQWDDDTVKLREDMTRFLEARQ